MGGLSSGTAVKFVVSLFGKWVVVGCRVRNVSYTDYVNGVRATLGHVPKISSIRLGFTARALRLGLTPNTPARTDSVRGAVGDLKFNVSTGANRRAMSTVSVSDSGRVTPRSGQ